MVFSFKSEIDNSIKIVEQTEEDQYILRTDGKYIIKIQKMTLEAPPEWLNLAGITLTIPKNLTVFCK